MAAKAPAKKKRGCGYKLAETFPPGEVLTDLSKQSWRIQASIGVGGFGKIYSACKLNENNPIYAVKVEPRENGPLFCERNIYMRIAKKEHLEEYKSLRKLKNLGMPEIFGFGSCDFKGTIYRFLVMQRYGKDLWSLFLDNDKKFPIWSILQIGIQVLQVLEYIHSKGYAHCDIKGSNLLLGFTKTTENQVYLVDFGLACKYSREEKTDPKKAHNGTIEYTSRDAHKGIITMRGDIEILAFNLLHWASSDLPWGKITNTIAVENEKRKYMSDLPSLIKKCYKNNPPHPSIVQIFEHVNKLKFNETPDYKKLLTTLQNDIKKSGHKLDEKLEFSCSNKESSLKKTVSTKSLKENKVKKELKRKTSEATVPSPRSTKSSVKLQADEKVSWKTLPTIVNGAKCLTQTETDGVKSNKRKKK